ncbi:PTS system mannose/fructose/N-acetylgalactosamine-transporter subunit IIB [Lactobacillus hominis]|uniref:Possible N(Pi)-phosphohistidine--sugar phosphotransferase n=1 Tax=Lactobacillus hominis DSM 23910 = CRBIP 24.179 TaxID=1423758 RepID=I7L6M4_9LACO|nr:PTS sugar transporter subunit IIB [Lactobacillus hominis]KRM84564.1 N(pi)-phosphohistidine--sugar phosphotransferase [Lactobacillus hominis DSM 23910 = CRBIP 24.179]MCT3348099.1 PTS mannose/fructose/sorbose transporter subunit IIB [Lactobacillus hominis]CCI82107.1 Possible N(Pi)-phosphohistidine--sugar phosphotransferase [Lactobacillus hominis DSM 23910 = CRBIP 24.179]
MSIVGARIDGRLVHGQVANLWTPKLQADRIIVVDEQAADNDIQKSGLRMATPMTTRLSVLKAAVAADHLNKHRYGNQRVFIVAKKPAEFLALLNMGLKLDTLNVGTMSQTDTTKSITKQINVEEKDVEDFKQIADKGVNITAQLTPSDDSHDFMKLLNDKLK